MFTWNDFLIVFYKLHGKSSTYPRFTSHFLFWRKFAFLIKAWGSNRWITERFGLEGIIYLKIIYFQPILHQTSAVSMFGVTILEWSPHLLKAPSSCWAVLALVPDTRVKGPGLWSRQGLEGKFKGWLPRGNRWSGSPQLSSLPVRSITGFKVLVQTVTP